MTGSKMKLSESSKNEMKRETKPKPISIERVIEYLRTAIFDGNCGLNDVPHLIKRVIQEDLWQKRILPKSNERVTFSSFEEFLRTSPPQGLGTQMKTIQKLCAEDLEILELLEQIKTKRFWGGDRKSEVFKVDIINFEKAKKGTSVEYSLKRLRKQRPDLHQSVLAGKISVHQAMIKAGFRKPKFQITKDLEKIVEFIKKEFNQSEIAYLLEKLMN